MRVETLLSCLGRRGYQKGYIGLCADMGLHKIEFGIDELKNGKATDGD